MNPDSHSHGASMSLQDATVELDGHMALSDVTFDADAGTLMSVVGPYGAGTPAVSASQRRADVGPLAGGSPQSGLPLLGETPLSAHEAGEWRYEAEVARKWCMRCWSAEVFI